MKGFLGLVVSLFLAVSVSKATATTYQLGPIDFLSGTAQGSFEVDPAGTPVSAHFVLTNTTFYSGVYTDIFAFSSTVLVLGNDDTYLPGDDLLRIFFYDALDSGGLLAVRQFGGANCIGFNCVNGIASLGVNELRFDRGELFAVVPLPPSVALLIGALASAGFWSRFRKV